ncbi:hypothetical protein HanLR1_Chr15g0567271 [Helianthus annuus]|nr:hypothetical protein HanLR1_Chr15g0567271 [Helianthus annuus]
MGKAKVAGGYSKETRGNQVPEKRECEKVLVVPDRTVAFKELLGLAVVGKTVDLETLVDFDRLLRIIGTVYLKIQYLGGLSILIAFNDEATEKRFLEARVIWGPWIHGVPLHVLEPEVLSRIGELFGKVLHVPRFLEEDQDLSIKRVGVLAGEVLWIKENVILKWKNRSYRVRVEEEQDEWIPDCLGFANLASQGGTSSVKSLPMTRSWTPGTWNMRRRCMGMT